MMRATGLQSSGMGFLAGGMAVLTAHQLVVYGLFAIGLIDVEAWSTEPVGPLGVAAVLSNAFWGGIWGAVFALIAGRLPGASLWRKGLVFGLVFPLVIGAWIVVPLIKSEPFFAALSAPRLLAGVLVHAAYGAVLGAIYGQLLHR